MRRPRMRMPANAAIASSVPKHAECTRYTPKKAGDANAAIAVRTTATAKSAASGTVTGRNPRSRRSAATNDNAARSSRIV